MQLRQLQTLVAICDHKGFNRAAEALNMTPSAVSMQIRALERELNLELFDRRYRPPAFNNAAYEIVRLARRMIEVNDEMHRTAQGSDSLSGRITLGAISSASVNLLPESLKVLSRRFPRMQVRVVGGLTDDLLSRALSGELDAVIVTEPSHRDRKLRWHPLIKERFLIACHRGNPGGPVESTLQVMPFIRFNRRAGIGCIIDLELRRRGIVVNELMELDSIEAILSMVSSDAGVAIVPEFSVLEYHRRGIVTAPLPPPFAGRRITFATRARSETLSLADALLSELIVAASKISNFKLLE